MKINAEDLRLVNYFLEEKDVADCVNWDKIKEPVLEICPLLALYLETQRKADALKAAALKEVEDNIWELEDID